MINSLSFIGEKIAGRSINDACNIDTDKCYMLSFCGCKRELKSFDSFLQEIPGYVSEERGQTLSHDEQGNLVWISLLPS